MNWRKSTLVPKLLLKVKYSFHTLVSKVTGGRLWQGCHGDLLGAKRIAAFICHYDSYTPILQLAES